MLARIFLTAFCSPLSPGDAGFSHRSVIVKSLKQDGVEHASRLWRIHAHGSWEAVSVLLALRGARWVSGPGQGVHRPDWLAARPVRGGSAMRSLLRSGRGRPSAIAERQPRRDPSEGKRLVHRPA